MSLLADRRMILKAGGALVVAFSFPSASAKASDVPKTVAPERVDAFLSVALNGRITVYSGKVDLGTGVRTALTQIVAEELDCLLGRITIIEGDTALTPDQGTTSGSFSIQKGGMQLRRAAATARQALLRAAAARLQYDVVKLGIRDGMVIAASGRRYPIGDFVGGGSSLALKIDDDVTGKRPTEYTIVGNPLPRLDIPEKVYGRFTFMQDFRVPGMLHGWVVRPSAFGAELLSYDHSSIAGITGVVQVVRIKDFLGVVAETEWSAIKAAQQLKVSWSHSEGLPEQSKLWEHVRRTPIVRDEVTSRIGSSHAAFDGAPRKLAASYDFAIHTHGSIGPSCAVASFENGKLTGWTASQATHNLRRQLAANAGDWRRERPLHLCRRCWLLWAQWP